jgi:hypothetical protein
LTRLSAHTQGPGSWAGGGAGYNGGGSSGCGASATAPTAAAPLAPETPPSLPGWEDAR